MKKIVIFSSVFSVYCLLMICMIMGGCEQQSQTQNQSSQTYSHTQTQTQTATKPTTSRSDPLSEAMADFDATGEPDMTKNLYFIFDGSGSMDERPGGNCTGDQSFKKKLPGAKWAVNEFMKTVPIDMNIGLYVFDSNGRREVVSLGARNHDKFTEAVDLIESGRGTPLKESIIFGTDQLIKQYKKQLGYGSYRLVVVTDGEAEGIPRAVQYADKHGIPIYAIGLCIGEKHPLRTLVRSYQAADNFQDLAGKLEEVLAEAPSFDATAFEGL